MLLLTSIKRWGAEVNEGVRERVLKFKRVLGE